MKDSSYTRLHDKIEHALSARAKRDALYTTMKRGRDNRHKAVGLLPGGEPLFEAFKESSVEAIITESGVCKIQLLEGTDLKTWHPLEIPY